MKHAALALLLLGLALSGCSKPAEKQGPNVQASAQAAPNTELAALPPELRGIVDKPFTGDLDAMVERRLIRAGVPFNRTFYFIDKGVPRGLSYEYLTMFEDRLNKSRSTGNLKVHLVLVPMPRDALLPALQAGKLDVVVAQLTVTPERQKLVDFSNPTRTNVSEVVVTGPGSPAIASLDDLSGKRVFVRKSSSYYASLQALNQRFTAAGKAPVAIDEAPESLEDDDLLEMVNAGLLPAIVVDDFLADYWKQVFPKIDIHKPSARDRNQRLHRAERTRFGDRARAEQALSAGYQIRH
jgi:membrane-bound lytic murein transglycosylase MltF